MFIALGIVTAIALLELAVIAVQIKLYQKKANEIKYYKPIEIRKDV